jgi:uncharacterized membrane protein (UPF0127 family)
MRRATRHALISTSLLAATAGLALLALMVVGAGQAVVQTAPRWLDGLGRTELGIETADGTVHRFRAYLAETPEQQARGLMFVPALPADEGMLFAYDRPQHVSMWMKNTLIPLDMLFIRSDGTIANIAQRTVPGSLAAISSKGKVRAVLELNGGTAARLGIRPGERVRHAIFSGSGPKS